MKAAIILSAFATLIAGVNAVAMSENQHAERALIEARCHCDGTCCNGYWCTDTDVGTCCNDVPC
ncbi:uncharacterized protein CLUP02_04768 [Colletotrichum lupini]|uniref:Uncharacterized protein n=1 Tax=Colletotrichum lupini TaxID=145971 RepID=A0A9Q8SKZ2_9PEZI|nr:uncharacterized protein CLUP02_04768 [Colletotrichum lupini]UQC79289.1 hypothetical protein CLUP02_04768 [Colletotrichum lupini]